MQDYDSEIFLTHNEEKLVVTECFIETLKNENNKHLTGVLKNMSFKRCIQQCYSQCDKMKPVNVRPNTYINFDNHNNTRKPIFEAGETETFLQRLSTKLNRSVCD